jgi:hypothetical protein
MNIETRFNKPKVFSKPTDTSVWPSTSNFTGHQGKLTTYVDRVIKPALSITPY